MTATTIGRALCFSGALVFVPVVAYLQIVQHGYSATRQFMSELALGTQGQWMLFGFLMFALNVIGTAICLLKQSVHRSLPALLFGASSCLMGAGVVTLAESVNLHIAFVAMGFFAICLAMILMPRFAQGESKRPRAVCWSLVAIAGIATGLSDWIPVGVAQRITAACVLIWLVWAATARA
jgi:hypothetical protein